jgi:low affinity Fe/Cu permease
LQQIAIRFCSDKRGKAPIIDRRDRCDMDQLFRRIAEQTALLVGTPWAFILAAAITIAWGASGPLFGYSDTWQLVVNTGPRSSLF